MIKRTIPLFLLLFLVSCMGQYQGRKTNQISTTMVSDSTKQYRYNVDFLKKYTAVTELTAGNSSIAIVPGWQGRVITSTSEGDRGFSFGWINQSLISSRKTLKHMNAFGGEERLWLGPEGGQFAIFFKKGDDFTYNNWQTPAFLDTLPFQLAARTDSSVTFTYDTSLENYSGSPFTFRIEREVTLLSGEKVLRETGIDLQGVNFVAYGSLNRLINTGINEWKKESGLLSLWLLGMFNPSPSVVVVIPFRQGSDADLGIPVNDNYFGKIAPDRLKIERNNIYFRADGKSRGKIGIPPRRAAGVMGSYDFDNNILTLLFAGVTAGKDYVNSSWQIQDNPYSGDAFNSYNDGPLADGTQMGPFYELETSSPGAALKPGQSITHSQITVHITGKRNLLDAIVLKSLGTSLDEIEKVFR